MNLSLILTTSLILQHYSNRVTRGIPSDLASLNSVNTSSGASVMGMFNTTALYHDPLLDNPLYTSSSSGTGVGALRGGARTGSAGFSGSAGMGAVGSGVSGQKASSAGGAARRDNFDTASLRSQDDTAR